MAAIASRPSAFYEEHLGGRITMMMTHGQAPNASEVPAEWKNSTSFGRNNLLLLSLMAMRAFEWIAGQPDTGQRRA